MYNLLSKMSVAQSMVFTTHLYNKKYHLYVQTKNTEGGYFMAQSHRARDQLATAC